MGTRKVNIPQSNVDPFYRYQREPLRVAAGKANTTVITNLDIVAKQIYRTPPDLIVFLKKKTGTNAYFKDGSAVLKGTFTGIELDDLLESYIEDDVICQTCGNPETHGKKKTCSACGSSRKG